MKETGAKKDGANWTFVIVAALVVLSPLFLIILIPFESDGHAPHFPDSNTSPSDAYRIVDHSKSWVLYSSLPDETAHYYSLRLQDGDRLLIQVLVPVRQGQDGFVPHMALMIPGYGIGPLLPTYVDIPTGFGHEVITGNLPAKPDYEGITATAFYTVIDFDEMVAEFSDEYGEFLVAVYHPDGKRGDYALVVGYRETFTLTEIVFVPWSLLQIYLWAGNGLLSVVLPGAAVIVPGVAIIRRFGCEGLPRNLIALAGLTFLATSAVILVQMALALGQSGVGSHAVVTVPLIVIPAVLGAYTLKVSFEDYDRPVRARAMLLLLSVIGIFSWSGYIVGPLLLIAAAALLRFPDDSSPIKR